MMLIEAIAPYRTPVYYSRTIEELTSKSDYYSILEVLSQFPRDETLTDTHKTFRILEAIEPIKPRIVAKVIGGAGRRPATHIEALAFAAAHPEAFQFNQLLAFGTIWNSKGGGLGFTVPSTGHHVGVLSLWQRICKVTSIEEVQRRASVRWLTIGSQEARTFVPGDAFLTIEV